MLCLILILTTTLLAQSHPVNIGKKANMVIVYTDMDTFFGQDLENGSIQRQAAEGLMNKVLLANRRGLIGGGGGRSVPNPFIGARGMNASFVSASDPRMSISLHAQVDDVDRVISDCHRTNRKLKASGIRMSVEGRRID